MGKAGLGTFAGGKPDSGVQRVGQAVGDVAKSAENCSAVVMLVFRLRTFANSYRERK